MKKKLKNPILIKFDTRVYKIKAIKKAITAYSHLVEFKALRVESYLNLKIIPLKKGFNNILAGEFCNYVLAMTKRCY